MKLKTPPVFDEETGELKVNAKNESRSLRRARVMVVDKALCNDFESFMKENTIIVTQQPCPKCGKLNRFKMSPNVNGESDKIMAIHTLNGDIFFYRCDSCGLRIYIAYPVIARKLKKHVNSLD